VGPAYGFECTKHGYTRRVLAYKETYDKINLQRKSIAKINKKIRMSNRPEEIRDFTIEVENLKSRLKEIQFLGNKTKGDLKFFSERCKEYKQDIIKLMALQPLDLRGIKTD
jgi:hypothetical protein